MKKVILLLTGLVGLLSLVLTTLTTAPDKGQKLVHTAINQVPKTAYSINPDLQFLAINKQFYATISQELDHLSRQFDINKPIALSNNPKAQKIASHVYNLLQSKVTTIASRMGIESAKITICVQPIDTTLDASHEVYNAYGQTIKRITKNNGAQDQISYRHNLIITTELIKLLAWHEGDLQSSNKEGLLDGVLAHELGHISHAHMESNYAYELQADTTGAKGVVNPLNLIDATDVLYFAGNLHALLIAYNPNLHLDQAKILTIVTIIVSTLLRHNKGFGSYAECSHAQYSNNSSQAACKAVTRILRTNASGKLNTIISMLYDELKDSCKNPLQNTKSEIAKPVQKRNQAVAISSSSGHTHPDPISRRQHFMQSLKHQA